MNTFTTIQRKLEQFITKYYTNALLKGLILFFAIGVLYFLLTLFIEHMLWLNTMQRSILFWTFIGFEAVLFTFFIIWPVLHLFKLRRGINYNEASQHIGKHFPEVNDKLLNVLQLNSASESSDLLLASIAQKSAELTPIPFSRAVNFASNIKYLKYAAIPLLIIVAVWLSGRFTSFGDSYKRVVNYNVAYTPPAPFHFVINTSTLQTTQGKDFELEVSVDGNILPETVSIDYNNQSYFLQPKGFGTFTHTFTLPQQNITFKLNANGITSQPYELEVINTPKIRRLSLHLNYPKHTAKPPETLLNTGSATIPEGTQVSWSLETSHTTAVHIISNDTISFLEQTPQLFTARKRIFRTTNYAVSTSNDVLKHFENLNYTLAVVKDAYPELTIIGERDSTVAETVQFKGQASDDYGLTKLQLVYYPTQSPDSVKITPFTINNETFTQFSLTFPGTINLKKGTSYEVFFEVFDNDTQNGLKRTKSNVFTFYNATDSEKETQQLNEQRQTIESLSNSVQQFKNQQQDLKQFSKTQKEKKQLSFNDKRKFDEFLKSQKQQEALMKSFNKKLQDNLEKIESKSEVKAAFKNALQQRLKDNENQLKKDEKLLKQLEQLKDKINKEDFAQKLEELAQQNKNKQRSMKQLLELTKRFYVMKKTEKIANQLDSLSIAQKQTMDTPTNNQQDLSNTFKAIQKALDALDAENRKLQKPTKLNRDPFLEDEINYDQNQIELLQKQQNNSSDDHKKTIKSKQQQAAQKLQQLSQQMKNTLNGGGSGSEQAEDIEALRKILDNLLLFSFEQERLMNTFESIDVNTNRYGRYVIHQNSLKSHFEHIDDSLFALSLRQPKLSERVNTEISNVYYNIDKSLSYFTENEINRGTAAQQYTVTASNELASFLSDVLDNMEQNMKPSLGQGKGSGEQLPDIIMSQEQLAKDAQKAQEQKQGESDSKENSKEGSTDKGEDSGEKGDKGDNGNIGEKGNIGQNADAGQQGQKGQNSQKGEQGSNSSHGNLGQNGRSSNSVDQKNNQKDNTGKSKGDGKAEGNSSNATGKENGNKASGSRGSNTQKQDNSGYGQGGLEEQNETLFKIYQKQQMIRQKLENQIINKNKNAEIGRLIRQMETIETNLLNQGITNQTISKMLNVQQQLLKLDNATQEQGKDNKRQSKTNTKVFSTNPTDLKFTPITNPQTTELLNRKNLPFKPHIQKRINRYFSPK